MSLADSVRYRTTARTDLVDAPAFAARVHLRSGPPPATAQQVELIALRVGEHVPAFLTRLTDVGRPGPQLQQPLQLGGLVAVRGVDAGVQRSFSRFGAATGANKIVGSVPGKPSNSGSHLTSVPGWW